MTRVTHLGPVHVGPVEQRPHGRCAAPTSARRRQPGSQLLMTCVTHLGPVHIGPVEQRPNG
eukprot:1167681-Alexandrium_andersonii.AAC.1